MTSPQDQVQQPQLAVPGANAPVPAKILAHMRADERRERRRRLATLVLVAVACLAAGYVTGQRQANAEAQPAGMTLMIATQGKVFQEVGVLRPTSERKAGPDDGLLRLDVPGHKPVFYAVR